MGYMIPLGGSNSLSHLERHARALGMNNIVPLFLCIMHDVIICLRCHETLAYD